MRGFEESEKQSKYFVCYLINQFGPLSENLIRDMNRLSYKDTIYLLVLV